MVLGINVFLFDINIKKSEYILRDKHVPLCFLVKACQKEQWVVANLTFSCCLIDRQVIEMNFTLIVLAIGSDKLIRFCPNLLEAKAQKQSKNLKDR